MSERMQDWGGWVGGEGGKKRKPHRKYHCQLDVHALPKSNLVTFVDEIYMEAILSPIKKEKESTPPPPPKVANAQVTQIWDKKCNSLFSFQISCDLEIRSRSLKLEWMWKIPHRLSTCKAWKLLLNQHLRKWPNDKTFVQTHKSSLEV